MIEGENVKTSAKTFNHYKPRQRVMPDSSSGTCIAAIKVLTNLSDIRSKP
ncbi:hypothetical protein [Pedobacter sp.]